MLFQGYTPLGRTRGLNNPVLTLVAEKLGKSPAQVALRWGLQMGHSVLPKSTNEARIKENFDVLDWSIPEDLFIKFSEIKQASNFPIILLLFALFCWYLQNYVQVNYISALLACYPN